MKKQILPLAFLAILVLFACENDDNTKKTNELPDKFPLETGKAWKYERTYYENGAIDTTYFDTLYISDKHLDYFLYSWNPSSYHFMIKNTDDKLVQYGAIYPNDTSFYAEPRIWAFFGKTGCLDATNFENYHYDSGLDSLCISVEENKEYFDEKWNTYIQEKTFTDGRYRSVTYYNKLGFVHFKFYDENNNLTEENEMIEELENINPPKMKSNAEKVEFNHQKISKSPY
jgi:hypothetical protein